MEQKGKSFIKRIKFYVKLGVLAATPIVLTSCNEETNITPTPTTTIETVTPTGEPTVTPTVVVTPTPEPTPMPSERKISYKETFEMETIVNDYFGEEEDFETEFNKRKEYLSSFNVLDEKEINIVLTYANLMHLRDESVDDETRDKYLLFYNDENLQLVPNILDKIMLYNYDHLDDTIIISWLGTDKAWGYEEKVALCLFQNDLYTAKMNNSVKSLKFSRYYHNGLYCRIYNKEGKGTNETINVLLLNYSCKGFITAMSYNTIDRISKENNSSDVIVMKNMLSEFLDSTQKVMGDYIWLERSTLFLTGKYIGSPIYDDPNDPEYIGHSQQR